MEETLVEVGMVLIMETMGLGVDFGEKKGKQMNIYILLIEISLIQFMNDSFDKIYTLYHHLLNISLTKKND